MSARAHISRLERDGAAAAARRARPCSRRSTSSAIRPRRTPRAAARAPSIEDAREQVAALVGAKPAEVVFTSGGTEAQQRGAGRPAGTRSWSPASSTTPCWRRRAIRGARLIELPVAQRRRGAPGRSLAGAHGAGAAAAVRCCRCSSPTTRPACCSRSPTSPRLAKAHGLAVHTDAVQAAGRIAVDMRGARRRLPHAVRPQARRAQGRRRTRHSRARDPAGRSSRRRPGAAAPRRHRERGRHRRLRRRGRGRAARSRRHAARAARCATGWKAQVRAITPDAVVIGAERASPAQHDEPGAARHQRRDAGDRARSGRHRRQRRCRLLVGQGRGEPRAGGDGARAATSRAPPSASAWAASSTEARRREPSSPPGADIAAGRRERAVA